MTTNTHPALLQVLALATGRTTCDERIATVDVCHLQATLTSADPDVICIENLETGYFAHLTNAEALAELQVACPV